MVGGRAAWVGAGLGSRWWLQGWAVLRCAWVSGHRPCWFVTRGIRRGAEIRVQVPAAVGCSSRSRAPLFS